MFKFLHLKENLFLMLIILFELILYAYSNPSKHSRNLQSIIYLSPGAKMSDFLKNFQKSNKPYEDKRETKVIDYNNKEMIYVVQNNHKLIINLPRYLNSSIPAHDFFLAGITKNNVKLTELENYAYNVSYSNNLIAKFPKPIVRYPKPNKNNKYKSDLNLDLEFNLEQPDILPQFKSEFFFNLSNIVSINNMLVGTCYDNNLQLYYFYRLGIEELNVTDYFKSQNNNGNSNLFDIEKRKIKKILLDSTSQKNERYLLFVDFDDNILIYKQNSILTKSDGYKHTFIGLVDLKDVKLKGKNIVDFVKRGNTFFLGLENEGIMVISQNSEGSDYKVTYELKKFICQQNNTEMDLNVKDIQEIDNSIYVLIANFGLKILNVQDLNNIKFEPFEFIHPYIEKIEIHLNPNFKNYFLGVLISNRFFISGDEFFIEFTLEDEFSPKINRIYLSDKVISVTNILNDDYFTYIFEKNSNKFLVISRSSTANEFNSIFEIHSEQLVGGDLVSNPFIFTDEYSFFKHIGILTTNNFIYSKSVEFSSSDITFYFWEAGEYEVILYTFTDNCDGDVTKTKLCKINLRYLFDVSMLPNDIGKFSNNSYYVIVAIFSVYNFICLFVYKLKYAPNTNFKSFNDEYDLNVEKSNRSNKNQELGEQVIEMST